MKRIHGQKILIPLHPLENIEASNYFKYKSRFNGVLSRNNLPRGKEGVYIINHQEHIGFHYLLTEIHLYTLILLELNIFL